jgi:hypothetical protein
VNCVVLPTLTDADVGLTAMAVTAGLPPPPPDELFEEELQPTDASSSAIDRRAATRNCNACSFIEVVYLVNAVDGTLSAGHIDTLPGSYSTTNTTRQQKLLVSTVM